MPNDAKWGLLAGVVGVVVVAVLYFQERPSVSVPLPAATPVISQTTKPPQLFSKKPTPNGNAKQPPRAEKPEPEAQPVSRPGDN